MYTITNMYKGTGYNKNVRLIRREYLDGHASWEFRDRQGIVGNPSEKEAYEIISKWNLVESYK